MCICLSRTVCMALPNGPPCLDRVPTYVCGGHCVPRCSDRQAKELATDMKQRRKRSVTSIIGRAKLTPEQADKLMAGTAAVSLPAGRSGVWWAGGACLMPHHAVHAGTRLLHVYRRAPSMWVGNALGVLDAFCLPRAAPDSKLCACGCQSTSYGTGCLQAHPLPPPPALPCLPGLPPCSPASSTCC